MYVHKHTYRLIYMYKVMWDLKRERGRGRGRGRGRMRVGKGEFERESGDRGGQILCVRVPIVVPSSFREGNASKFVAKDCVR